MTRQTNLLLSVFLTLLSQPAAASEKYICHLDEFMEVANDGRFFGPEATFLSISISNRFAQCSASARLEKVLA